MSQSQFPLQERHFRASTRPKRSPQRDHRERRGLEAEDREREEERQRQAAAREAQYAAEVRARLGLPVDATDEDVHAETARRLAARSHQEALQREREQERAAQRQEAVNRSKGRKTVSADDYLRRVLDHVNVYGRMTMAQMTRDVKGTRSNLIDAARSLAEDEMISIEKIGKVEWLDRIDLDEIDGD